jgi:phosphonatase-like hydrolase
MNSAAPRIQLVVFDIAGTIIEDRGEVVSAFGRALRGHNIPFSDEELQAWKGASKRQVIRHFVERASLPHAEEAIERIYAAFRSELEQTYRQELHPIPGAASTFAWCRERGIRLATTTGFYSEISQLILDRSGWRDFFAANVSSSDVKRGRPAPFMIFRAMEMVGIENVRQVVNVGDTPLDLQAGSNAGVRGVIGVLTGSHPQDRLQREPHTHLLPSVAALPELIAQAF